MARRNTMNGAAVPMEPGERDKPVTIQKRPVADTVDTTDAPMDGPWSTLATPVWMRKLDLDMSRAAERLAANQMAASVDTQWELAYRSDMDPELLDVPKLRRLLFRGRVYDIVFASMIGRKEGIELLTLARSGVPA